MIDVSTYSKPANLPGFLVKLIRSSRVESSLRYGGDGQKFHHRCFRSMNFEGVHKKASVVTLDDGGNHQHLLVNASLRIKSIRKRFPLRRFHRRPVVPSHLWLSPGQ